MTAEPAACQSCGAEPSRESARFCDACGAPLPGPDSHAEFKQVTVLFADVVGSMDIAAAVGAERLREIMADLVGRGTQVIRRYGGTLNEFTGDGLMAVFGAPRAFEDHAMRACLAARDIHQEIGRLATEVRARDGVRLQLRVGLNSGQVIAGEIGSGIAGYHAVGEQVGLAQRMESVAPPGGVLLSESTARLVEHAATLAEPEWVSIKGSDQPVPARRLLGIKPAHKHIDRPEPRLVGRRLEMAAVEDVLDQAIDGRGGVVVLVGQPGIGKSRIAREATALATGHGVEVVWAFCESHAREVPFHVVTGLLQTATGITELDDSAARTRLRGQIPDADPEDLSLLDDLMGIADPDRPLPRIDPDARRRRLTALIHAASLMRTEPAQFVIEDVHWIDEVSESMLVDFLTVVPRTPSMVLITTRPEYQGPLTRIPGAKTMVLGPLGDSDTTALLAELLGPDPSVSDVTETITERAAGNPFFAEEIVRDLMQRGVLTGDRGGYRCRVDSADIAVPATVQAAIEARIDRLGTEAKQTLNAASVIGAHFDERLLIAVGIDPVFDELADAELIDQVRSTPAEYAFHHPLIRTVAYESQLKSDRAQLHLRLAAAIESTNRESADQNAALIAEHLEAAGETHEAYAWHMRAGAWSTHRDIAAARVSWERARRIADALPADAPGRTAMCIAPRTMLCGAVWRFDAHIAGHFEDLRELCALADDKASLALGMAGVVLDHMMHGRIREASRLASDQMALLEAIGDPALTVGAGSMAILMKYRAGEIAEVLRWSQTVIDWADGDPTKGNLIVGSPLAVALVWRGTARFWLGRDGWRQDLDDATAMARSIDPLTHTLVVFWKHGWTIPNGVLLADDAVVRELEEALQFAEGLGDDTTLGLLRYILGITLMQFEDVAEHQRGLTLLEQVRELCLHGRFYRSELPGLDLVVAIEKARRGDPAGAIPMIRKLLNDSLEDGQFGYAPPSTAFFVEALLDRGTEADLAEAEDVIDRAEKLPAGEGLVLRDIFVLRLRALLARALGDVVAYRDLKGRYRAMAESLGYEGHIAWAEAM